MAPYRIVLANNHAPLRQCLKRILKGKSDLEVIGEAEDGLNSLTFWFKQIGPQYGHS